MIRKVEGRSSLVKDMASGVVSNTDAKGLAAAKAAKARRLKELEEKRLKEQENNELKDRVEKLETLVNKLLEKDETDD